VQFDGNAPSFEIDIVLYDTVLMEALYVMDTKRPSRPQPTTIHKLAVALGVSIEEIPRGLS
jgi:hypothetical protein